MLKGFSFDVGRFPKQQISSWEVGISRGGIVIRRGQSLSVRRLKKIVGKENIFLLIKSCLSSVKSSLIFPVIYKY